MAQGAGMAVEDAVVLARCVAAAAPPALAAPIFGPGARVVGDTVLTIPEARFDQSQEDHLAQAVRDCSEAITRELGGQTPQG
jgi:DNA-binding IclR family transcriptional regulator